MQQLMTEDLGKIYKKYLWTSLFLVKLQAYGLQPDKKVNSFTDAF